FEKIFYRLVGPDVFQSMIRVESAATSEDSTETAAALTDYQSISIPVVSQADARLLQDVLEFYDLFAAQNEDRPELQFNSAVAYRHVGDIHLRLGQLDEARDAYIRAIQQYKRQATDHEKEIASIRNQLGQVYANQRMLTAARDSYSLVIEALEKAEGTPRFEDQRWRYELARAHDFMGSLGTRQREEGREAARRNSRSRRGPEGRRGPEARRRPPGSRRRDNPRRLAARLHGPSSEERRNHHATAQRLLAKLIEESPDKSEYKLAKARSCRNFASYLSRSRNQESKDQAPVLVQEAIEILEALVDESTQLPHFRFELAETLISIRPSRSDTTESQERADHRAGRLWSNRVERAEKILRTLRDKYPTVHSYTEGLARALHERHHILMRKRERVLGIATLRESIGLLEGLRERWPANAEYLRTIAERRMAYAGLLERESDPSGLGLNPALEQIQKSITEFETFRNAKFASPPGSEQGLVSRYRLMARILDRLGRIDEAEAARTKSRQLQEGSGR
ncbi:MAG: tetratricopeptide repeat protein, partial [Planctomycetota bacterium]|nr:tetratricopeptide repeat protein [Planctomycetota bacterium]